MTREQNKEKTIKFAVFADLHYKKGMYISSLDDLRVIFDKSDREGAELVINLGDLCNDYVGSPELVSAYLGFSLPVYGVYGNHELESRGNSMELVTPLLCNRPVLWGTDSGETVDGHIGYYYFDVRDFRFICLDSNYSQNPDTGEWEHNRTASWGAPPDNVRKDSLGDVQLEWLSRLLDDSASRGLHCLIFSHMGFSGRWASSPDTEAVQDIINEANCKRPGTVLLCASGHLHTDNAAVIDSVLHLDVNTTRNGLWLPTAEEHYGDMTYPYTEYDADGSPTAHYDRPLREAWMSGQAWFFDKPLYAIITVSTDGRISVEGNECGWYGGIVPDPKHKVTPKISSGDYKLF